MEKKSRMVKFHAWRLKHIKHRQFVIILAAIVGLSAGLGAAVLKNLVHLIQNGLTSAVVMKFNYLFFIYPIVGMTLAVLFLKYVLKERVSHGIPAVLYAISKRSSIMKRHNMFSSVIASALTVGFGGSAGLEGPTVATGSSIGSNLGRFLRLNYKTITLLLGCGAAGAMAGIFNAPIAAIVFALEVIMLDLTMSSLVPLLVASVTAALTSHLLIGDEILFHIDLSDQFNFSDVIYFVMLGILTGLTSVYFIKTYWFISDLFDRVDNTWKKLMIGGGLLGVIIFFIPPLYGEGYKTIIALLEGHESSIFEGSPAAQFSDNVYLMLILVAIMVLIKVVATSVTFGAGGIGGVFAPTLFMGAATGFVFSKAINTFEIGNLSVTNFSLVGMCGMIAGVLHAPLTAIFLIAEITSGYELFLPLMITGTISFITVRSFVPHSVYTMQLAKRGELITHHKDSAVLTLMKLNSEVERDFSSVQAGSNLGELVKVVSKARRNLFPVLDAQGSLVGIINLDHIREIMFKTELYEKVHVESLMTTPPAIVSPSEPMDQVMTKFEETGMWNLPVCENNKYVGFVSKSKLFSAYRKILLEHSEH
ncbi:MAG: chloride channel protein [Vicingaceae bacterium]